MSGTGNRRTFTVSMWIKRTEIGVTQYLWEAGIRCDNDEVEH
jgi:hypothetical protein